jgi:peptidoglycan/LPS O-acetylase OafA/YrhL
MSEAAVIGAERRSEDVAETGALAALKPHALPQLDGLRFIAAFLVLVAHSWDAHKHASVPGLSYFTAMLAGVGLSLFFVLSGFVIHYNYHRQIPSPGGTLRFGLARFARLYPLYGILLLFDLLWYGRIREVIGGDHQLVYPLLFSASLTQTWWYAVVGQHNLLYHFFEPIMVAWSISTEIFLYFLYPLICLFLIRFRSSFANAVLVAACIVSQVMYWVVITAHIGSFADFYQSVFGRVIYSQGTITGGAADFNGWVMAYAPAARFWQFAFGCALANLYLNRPFSASSAHFLLGPGIALFLLFAFHTVNSFFISPQSRALLGGFDTAYYPLTLAAFAVLGGFVIYASARAPSAPISRFLGSPLMVKGGDVSYASYLLHTWLLSQVGVLLFPDLLPDSFDLAGAIQMARVLIAWAGILLISYAVFVFFEAPARRWIRAYISPRLVLALIGLQLSLFLAGVCFVTGMQRAAW